MTAVYFFILICSHCQGSFSACEKNLVSNYDRKRFHKIRYQSSETLLYTPPIVYHAKSMMKSLQEIPHPLAGYAHLNISIVNKTRPNFVEQVIVAWVTRGSLTLTHFTKIHTQQILKYKY